MLLVNIDHSVFSKISLFILTDVFSESV